MRKAFLCMIIIAAITSLLLAGCSGDSPSSSTTSGSKTTSASSASTSSGVATSEASTSKKSYTSDSSSSSFTNKYGTATTLCAHQGCTNFIASSGDTNCCTTHSNRCLECNKYIDEDAMYCMDCLTGSSGKSSSSSSYSSSSGSGKKCQYEYANGSICGKPVGDGLEYYCTTHYKELLESYDEFVGN